MLSNDKLIPKLARNKGDVIFNLEWMKRANEWRREAERNFPLLTEKVDAAIQEAVKKSDRKGHILPLDMMIMQFVGVNLQNLGNAENVNLQTKLKQQAANFIEFSNTLFSEHAEQANLLKNHLTNVANQNQPFIAEGLQLIEKINRAKVGIELWGIDVTKTVDGLKNNLFPVEIREFTDMIGVLANHVTNNFNNNASSFFRELFIQTTKVTETIDVLYDQAKGLIRQIESTPQNKLALESTLRSVNKEIEAKQKAIASTIDNIGQGIKLGAGIFQMLGGNAKLAQDIVVIASAGVEIAKNIALIAAGSLATGPAAPFVAIGGAIVTIISHFLSNNGPSPEQLIMDQINRLSEHLDRRFDRLENMLQAGIEALGNHINHHFEHLHGVLGNRFNRLEEQIGRFYEDAMLGMRGLHAGTYDTQVRINRVKAELQWQSQLAYLYYENQFMQQYNFIKGRIQLLNTQLNSNAALELMRSFTQNYLDLQTWVLTEVKSLPANIDLTRAGLSAPRAGVLSVEEMATQTDSVIAEFSNSVGVVAAVNVLAHYANRRYNIPFNGDFFHVTAWADAVWLLLNAHEYVPQLYARSNLEGLKTTFDKIKAEAYRYQAYVKLLKTSTSLFENLLKNYRNSVINVINAAYDVILDPTQAGVDMKPHDALMRLQALRYSETFIREEVGQTSPTNPTAVPEFWSQESAFKIEERRDRMHATVASKLRYDRAFNNDSQRNEFYQKADFMKECEDMRYVFNEVQRLYKGAIDSAKAWKSYYDDLENRLVRLRDNTNQYRTNRILKIASDAAHFQRKKAREDNRLPNDLLMKEYFFLLKNEEIKKWLKGTDVNRQERVNALNNALSNMSTCYQFLSLFTALAFPEEYGRNPEWTAYFEAIWDQQEYQRYLNNSPKNDDFIVLKMQNELLPLVDKFTEFLLGKVHDMLYLKSKAAQIPANPVVEEVIEGIETYISFIQVAYPALVERANQVIEPQTHESNAPKQASTLILSGNMGGRANLSVKNNSMSAGQKYVPADSNKKKIAKK